ncbi:hypothetical protein SEMRO_1069_G237660.1 [Seminavis robusta]|uniref:Uncharacterized protein n=1 Tax=Seminavis robusta TaxID=568900 RepID=A0A9N8HPH6_9STRA|nr:hypothetical protein SEMRO_1069_G237660.1 [Seminavis robusta]|eukprot:Sro1069_g237660.1 n/a (301) ;mRNA; f:34133-35035
MSQEKRRCPSDYSLEELEELEMELKRRRMESNEPPASIAATANNNTTNNDNKGTLSIHTSRSILWDLLQSRSDFEIIRTLHVNDAMVLLRQHPSLVTKPFQGRSVLSFFMRNDVPSSIIQELCAMWKSINPQNDEDEDWQSTGFEEEPNFVLDACRYCSNPDTFRLLVKEFPDQAAIEDGPCELFLKRCDYDDYDDFDCEPRPPGQEATEIFQVLFESYRYEAKDLKLGCDVRDLILGCCYDQELSDLLSTVVSKVFEERKLELTFHPVGYKRNSTSKTIPSKVNTLSTRWNLQLWRAQH